MQAGIDPPPGSAVIEALGLVAALLTTASFVPQVLQTVRTRSANDISTAWLLLFATGIVLWFIYGMAIWSWPVIIANGLTFVLLLVICWIKFGLPSANGKGN
jgi:MtN3 and saliva related transmembrane protein